MGLTRRRFRVTAREAGWVQDWADAELVERVEAIEAQVEILDAERERLESGLAKRVEAIEAQVEILDAERTELENALSVGPGQAPRTVRLPQAEDPEPAAWVKAARIDWGKLALFLAFVLLPWFVIGALIFAVWLLLAW
jgi:hypothetical protein